MHSYQEGARLSHFVIQVPGEKVEAVVRALEQVGIGLDPQAQMVAWDPGRDYTHAGADCSPPLSLGDDLPDTVRPVNEYLEEKGIRPLRHDPEGMGHQQFHECLSLTNNEVTYGLSAFSPAEGRHAT